MKNYKFWESGKFARLLCAHTLACPSAVRNTFVIGRLLLSGSADLGPVIPTVTQTSFDRTN